MRRLNRGGGIGVAREEPWIRGLYETAARLVSVYGWHAHAAHTGVRPADSPGLEPVESDGFKTRGRTSRIGITAS